MGRSDNLMSLTHITVVLCFRLEPPCHWSDLKFLFVYHCFSCLNCFGTLLEGYFKPLAPLHFKFCPQTSSQRMYHTVPMQSSLDVRLWEPDLVSEMAFSSNFHIHTNIQIRSLAWVLQCPYKEPIS